MPTRDVDDLINERIAWVDEELRAVLRPTPGEPQVYAMLRYHLGWTDAEGRAVDLAAQRRFGGKRLRGVLVVLACEACGGVGSQAVPAGATVELIHNFSLIHDDITREAGVKLTACVDSQRPATLHGPAPAPLEARVVGGESVEGIKRLICRH
jgi:hypothetical protein